MVVSVADRVRTDLGFFNLRFFIWSINADLCLGTEKAGALSFALSSDAAPASNGPLNFGVEPLRRFVQNAEVNKVFSERHVQCAKARV